MRRWFCVGYIPPREKLPEAVCAYGQHTRRRIYRHDMTLWLGRPQYDCECGSTVSEDGFRKAVAA